MKEKIKETMDIFFDLYIKLKENGHDSNLEYSSYNNIIVFCIYIDGFTGSINNAVLYHIYFNFDEKTIKDDIEKTINAINKLLDEK